MFTWLSYKQPHCPFALSLSKAMNLLYMWFDKLTTNGLIDNSVYSFVKSLTVYSLVKSLINSRVCSIFPPR